MNDNNPSGEGHLQPLRVLIIEDCADDAVLLERELRKTGHEVTSRMVDTAAAMRAALEESAWDLIISDHQMPNFSSMAALALLQASGQDLPFIIVSGTIDDEDAVSAMKAGAHDYLTKGKLARLAPAVVRELADAGVRRQRKQAEENLHASLREKESLLKEVHHRVKNNLQVIISLLRLEARRNEEPDTMGVLREMENRIRSMSLLHETLYSSGVFSRVDLAKYLKQLVEQLFRAHNSKPGAVRLHMDLEPVHVEMDQANPCGLIVNEWVTNSLKHAFPHQTGGEVRIALRLLANGQVSVQVSDTGSGLRPDRDTSKTLGLELVSNLARQLHGTLDINAPGQETCFTLTFTPTMPQRV